MISKAIHLVEQNDIDALIQNEVPEGRTLDYKESLPGNSDADKKEFLADVSSFANAAGGDLIVGIAAKRDSAGRNTGVPERFKGLPSLNLDQERTRLENMIFNGIEPRLHARFHAVEGQTARY